MSNITQENIVVLPSKRAIREHLLNDKLIDGFKSRYISIGDFFSDIIVLKYPIINEDLRYIFLKEASNFSSFNKLKISSNFFTFLKEGKYILKLFDELANELVDINDIETADTYSEYDEHLSILKVVRDNYKNILDREKFSDIMFRPEEYKLNKTFLNNIVSIKIVLEGYLTNFEFMLLKEVSDMVDVTVEFISSEYNSKMLDKFNDNFLVGNIINYNLSKSRVISESKLISECKVLVNSLSNRTLQVAYVKKKIYDYVQAGYSPEEIVVITPDESFAKQLRVFDIHKNFNFAMGESLSNSRYYIVLEAILQICEEDDVSSHSRVEYYNIEDIGQRILSIYNSSAEVETVIDILNELLQYEKQNRFIVEIKEQIYKINIFLQYYSNFTYKEILTLFHSRLGECRVDDVLGGKITVMGVLELRGISEFKAGIIVDFNDNIVPNTNSDDMFLNDKIKQRSNLVTSKDRYDLQKYYYKRIFDNCEVINIVYVKDKSKIPSRYIYDFNFSTSYYASEDELYRVLLDYKNITYDTSIEKLEIEYDFSKTPLSATMLNTYLKCPRKFYYKYIVKLEEHEIPKNYKDSSEIGLAIHMVLYEIFNDNKPLNKETISEVLKSKFSSNIFEKFNRLLWEHKLDKFIKNENARYKEGYAIYALEKNIETIYKGFKLRGTIDRIDILDGKLHLIDYKTSDKKITGKLKDDIQLTFYHLLASKLGKVASASFYNLSSGVIEQNHKIQDKLLELDELLDEFSNNKIFNFELCESNNSCKYCKYVVMCNRD